MATTTVLLVAEDESIAAQVAEVASSLKECRFQVVPRAELARAPLQRGAVGLVIVHLPSARAAQEVVGVLHEAGQAPRRVATIVLSETDDPSVKLSLLRLGAVDCLSSPFDLTRLAFLADVLTVRHRYEQPRAVGVSGAAPEKLPHGAADFLYVTPVTRKLMQQVRAVAPLESTVLLTGETGTGKTHLAKVIHDLSPRKAGPFIVIDCGALAPALFEGELFGNVRGAFTGADQDRPGKFSEAIDGTLLLDDIDCVPLEIQAKLLRAVEDRVYEPVGSNRPRKLRARLVIATNRPLDQEVAAGRFRKDLYYRLNVVSLHLAPLREQRESIRALAEKFLVRFCARAGRELACLSAAALAALEAHDWPGNVRELRNVIERAVALYPGPTIDLDDLPERIQRQCPTVPAHLHPPHHPAANELAQARYQAELKELLTALRRNNNNRTRTAMELGISRVTLYKKLHRYGLI